MSEKQMEVILIINVSEDELGEAWQLICKLNSICECLGSEENSALKSIRETLESELEKSGWIPF